MITVEPAKNIRGREIAAFYQKRGYGNTPHPNDAILEARDRGKLVGVVRLAEENGALVLRGMYVAKDSQRHHHEEEPWLLAHLTTKLRSPSGMSSRKLWVERKLIGKI